MKNRDILAIFNRGIVSRLGLARVDVNRVALSAAEQVNWMPRVLGSMSLRPGTEYLGNTKSDATGVYIPFVFARSDTAILEMTPSVMRVWDDGEALVTRPSVSAAIANGEFTTDLASWTDADETGAASTWVAGDMQLLGTRYEEARRRQSVSITETTTVHALRVVVSRGPVLIRIGTTAGDDDVFSQAVLRTGVHSLAFTPGAATIHIEFASSLNHPVLVGSVAIESAGTLELPTPWTAASDQKLLRWQRINDVVFVACDGYQQRRIERRPNNSWSVVVYETNDGPFLGPNTDGTRLTPSAISGEITVTSSRSLFRSSSVGRIFSLTSQGQQVTASISSEGSFSNDIRITGVGADRAITITRAGTWVGTVTLQRSDGEPGSYVDVTTYTTNGTVTFNDGLDNSISFYRIGIDTGDYTSGTSELTMTVPNGSITGVIRVTGYTSNTEVTAVVLSDLGGTAATEIWEAGSWNDADGYPTAVAFYEGRLWWFGRGRLFASVSDAFDSFDPNTEGDAAPINRSVGDGATDRINWALPVQRLIVGSDSAEHSARSNSFDEPITPSNFNIKVASTQGSAPSPIVQIDSMGVFIHASGVRVYEVDFSVDKQDYATGDATALAPEIGEAGFSRLSVQRQPDTRVNAVLADGKMAVFIRDRAEDVKSWVRVETDGDIEDTVVLPGDTEDRVYWMVKRVVNGAEVRFHEKVAREDQCRGGTLNRQADAAVIYQGLATSTITGLDHLEGESVVVWGDGADLGAHTVSGGRITLATACANVCAGLGYRARYQSAKLAAQLQSGVHIGQRARIDHIGLILADTHSQGLSFGPAFDIMDSLPLVEDGADVTTGSVWESYDEDMIEFPGEWSTDIRLCLEANAPRPCTVMGAVLNVDRQESHIG